MLNRLQSLLKPAGPKPLSKRSTEPVPLDTELLALKGFLQVVEVDPGPFISGASFQRKFGHQAPDFRHHLEAMYRKAWDHLVPVGYVNFRPHENVYLVGGGLTDGRAFQHMEKDQAQAINDAGGILYLMLRAGFARFTPRCDAFFGHVGNPRALEVDLKAGFQHTPYEHLVAYFPHPIKPGAKRKLTDSIHALGAF